MSPFAFSVRPNLGRSIGVLLAVAAVIAGTVYFGRMVRDPLSASQLNAIVPSFTPLVARETLFPQSESVEWVGTITGVLAGGQGIAVRRSDTGQMFQAYLKPGETASITGGEVRIAGLMTGISCAYAETVFGGQCTPSVEIDSIEQLSVEP